MDKKTKVQVRIFDNKYTLVGNENEEYINKIADDVDKMMHSIALNSDLKPIKISVLSAVNFCDEYHKASMALESAKADLKKYKDEIEELRRKINAYEEERRFLKDEILSLRKRR